MNIYEYDDISKFLKDAFHKRLSLNSNLSLKSISNKMGISSASAFNQMLRGQRPVPAKFLSQFTKELKLNTNEANYFNELYLKSKSTDTKLHSKILKKINPKNWRKKLYVSPESFNSPLSFVIKTFSKRNIDLNLEILKKHFSKNINEKELEIAYQDFSKTHIRTKANQRQVTKPDTDNSNIKKAHHFFLDLAKLNLETTEVSRREYNSYSINIQEQQIPEIKDRIRFFLDSMIEDYGNDHEADATFQIGGYFYPLTKKSEQ